MPEVTVGSIMRDSHEASNLLPMMRDNEYAVLKRNIEVQGCLDPVWFYEEKILDGRNRVRAVRELNAEGKTFNGKEYGYQQKEFKGNLQEAIEFVESKGLARRHLNSSQKAVYAVTKFNLARKVAETSKRRGEALTALNEELVAVADGNVVDYLAAQAGTNRNYIYNVIRIVDAEADKSKIKRVLQEIMNGEKTVANALKEIEGVGEQESPASGGDQGVPVVMDGLKRAVPEAYFPVFSERQTFKQVDHALKDVEDALRTICIGPGGMFVHDTEVLGLVKNLRKNLKLNQPFAICPVCDGTKRDPSSARRECPLCHKAGYVSKLLLNSWEQEQGRVAEAGDEEDETEVAEAGEPVSAKE